MLHFMCILAEAHRAPLALISSTSLHRFSTSLRSGTEVLLSEVGLPFWFTLDDSWDVDAATVGPELELGRPLCGR